MGSALALVVLAAVHGVLGLRRRIVRDRDRDRVVRNLQLEVLDPGLRTGRRLVLVDRPRGVRQLLGFSYYQANRDRLNALDVDGGRGCVAPSVETVQSGAYQPLSRPLFVYVRKRALEREPVRAFVEHMLRNHAAIAKEALFVPLSPEQLERQLAKLEDATA